MNESFSMLPILGVSSVLEVVVSQDTSTLVAWDCIRALGVCLNLALHQTYLTVIIRSDREC
jgi:hypothetical protein